MASYIYFTPATDVAAVNFIAEANGHGPDNISVPLVDTVTGTHWFGAQNGYGPDSLSIPLVDTVTGDPWYGTHSFVNLLEESPTQWPASEFTVIVEIYEDGDSQANWQDALTNNNLVSA